jgi:hypothetical protein
MITTINMSHLTAVLTPVDSPFRNSVSLEISGPGFEIGTHGIGMSTTKAEAVAHTLNLHAEVVTRFITHGVDEAHYAPDEKAHLVTRCDEIQLINRALWTSMTINIEMPEERVNSIFEQLRTA